MDKYLIKLNNGQPSSSSCQPSANSQIVPKVQREAIPSPPSNVNSVLRVGSLETDPKERIPISQYSPNIRDEVRRYFIQRRPCQPIDHDFPKTKFGNKMRQFNPDWFKGSYSQWLEYSIKADATFCLCCYLFKKELESRGYAGDAFTKDGFRGWIKGSERYKAHVVRFLLRNGFPFRGHNESEDSECKGVFLELLEFHGDKHPDVEKVILHHAPKNDIIICPTIQKEIVDACAKETTKTIIKDLDSDYFGILVDESNDISHKDQMALVLRYVNKNGEPALILPVTTASVERTFSSMKLIKNDLRNSIGDEFLNGCLVYNIERKVFGTVSNDSIMDRFRNMKARRVQM
uniref:Zinc finger MYM-type protein 1-like n=1 Tax=Nicotiana tabacum TaxID=4097 RepID=A0A1S3ZZT6_TOBAC|nr:PREDICTED: zinc finger MYM-type protein 1-like [Nicotiana tabacum]